CNARVQGPLPACSYQRRRRPVDDVRVAISVEIRRVESPVASGIRLGCTKSAISCAKRDSDRGKIAASDHIGISIVIKITHPREALANSITGSGTKSTVAISKKNRSEISVDYQVIHAIALALR